MYIDESHNLSLNNSPNTSWIVDSFTKVRAARVFYNSNSKIYNNYKYINFLNATENSFKTLLFWFQLWFLPRTGKAPHSEETKKVEVLEGKFLH